MMSPTKTSASSEGSPANRRLVAVVYADMVGYSRLIGLDDIGTLERLRTLRSDVIDPAIAEHGGRFLYNWRRLQMPGLPSRRTAVAEIPVLRNVQVFPLEVLTSLEQRSKRSG